MYKLAAWLLERAKLAAEGNLLPMTLAAFESEIHRELLRFWAAMGASGEDLTIPGKNLMRLAERIGYRVTRAADDTVEGRPMDRSEIMAVVEECVRCLPRDVAEQLRARVRGAGSPARDDVRFA